MFKALGDGTPRFDLWMNNWLKGFREDRLPFLFELGFYGSKVQVSYDTANLLYREYILGDAWHLSNCYADFLCRDGVIKDDILRLIMVKTFATLAYRKSKEDPSEDWKMFSERNMATKSYNQISYDFEYPIKQTYTGEFPKKEDKAESLYYKGKVASGKRKERLLLKSANYGYVPAFSELGYVYEDRDAEESKKWFERGVEYCSIDACWELAKQNKGTKKAYDYLLKCYKERGVLPNVLMCLAEMIKDDMYSPRYQGGKDGLILDVLGRVIINFSHLAEDGASEVVEARLMLAELIFDGKLALDGVFAYALCELCGGGGLKGKAEAYKKSELAKIKKVLTPKISYAYKLLNCERMEKADKERLKKEALELARLEEEIRKETERQEAEARKRAEEERLERERKAEIERKKWEDPLGLDKNPEYTRYNGQNTAKYREGVALYEKAINTHGEDAVVKALTLAGVAGHKKAMMALAEYYHKKDEGEAKAWVEKYAEHFDLGELLGSRWKWTIEECLLYMSSKVESVQNEAGQTLENLNAKKYTQAEQVALKALAEGGNIYAVRAYAKWVKNKDVKEWEKYAYKLALDGDEEAIKSIVASEGDLKLSSSTEYVTLLNAPSCSHVPVVRWQRYRALSNRELANKLGVDYSLEKAFGCLKSLEKDAKAHDLKKKVFLELARCYEYGIGTDVALWYASKHYEGYDDKKAKDCLMRYEAKAEGERRERFAIKLMEKYPCAELSRLLISSAPEHAKKIISEYKKTLPERLETELKERDEYLKYGFKLSEIYDADGKFTGHLVKYKYLRKKEEERAEAERIRKAKEERERALREEEKQRLLRAEAERQKAVLASQRQTQTVPQKPYETQSVAPKAPKLSKKELEQIAINKVRSRYGYTPTDNYDAKLEYFFRMCEDKDANKLARMSDGELEEEIAKRLGVPTKRVMSEVSFLCKLTESIEKFVSCCPSVQITGMGYSVDYHHHLERELAGLPVYGGTLNVEVSFLQDIRYFIPTGESVFYKEYDAFMKHEISNVMTFEKYAQEAGVWLRDYEQRKNEEYSGKKAARAQVRAIVNTLFNAYNVVCLKLISARKRLKNHGAMVAFIPTKIKVTFNFWGND